MWELLAAGGKAMIPIAIAAVLTLAIVLERFWSEYASGAHAVKELPASLVSIAVGMSPEAAVRHAFEQAEGVVLVLTDIEDAQRLAVQLKLRRRQPSIVMRWWDRPANLKGWTETMVSGSPSGSMSLPSASMRTRTPADVAARSSRATGGRSAMLGSTMVTRTVASASSP